MARPSALVLSFVVATTACGAGAAPPPVSARPGPPPASADELLIKGAIETDADLAKAIREFYTKYEYRIPMRDGAKLYTVAYVPKDPLHTYPILMQRTPYSVEPYGIDVYPTEKTGRGLRVVSPSKEVIKEGYIIVLQDVRGRMMSEGTFVDVRPLLTESQRKTTKEIDEATDTYDSIDFLVKNVPNNSGKVGTWGISYPGFYAAQSAVDAHPALKAVSPQAPVTEWFIGDDFHHNGVLFLGDSFRFLSNFGRARPEPSKRWPAWTSPNEGIDNYEFFLEAGPISTLGKKHLTSSIGFWNDLMAHPNRDAWWKARDPRPSYKNAKPAVMTVGGWFDAEDLFGALETYRSFEKQSPRNENVLVMGPWRHGGWARSDGDHLGDIGFGQKTSQFYREKIELPFFQKHLKGKKGPATPEAYVFETGTNTWHQYPAWPPPSAHPATLFLHDRGKLDGVAPTQDGDDAWLSDPKKPVPYIGQTAESTDAEYMIGDQRFAARRPDVMVYATKDLDADLVLAGPIEASLWVSTTGTDADFVVKVVDVWPNDVPEPDPNPKNLHMGGYQELVRAEVMRAKFRNSYESPEPMKPNEPTLVKITLPDVSHAFRTGHKLMVQIQSSWFPLADRNPQTFVDITKATDADFKPQTHRIFHGAAKPSSLNVTVGSGTLTR